MNVTFYNSDMAVLLEQQMLGFYRLMLIKKTEGVETSPDSEDMQILSSLAHTDSYKRRYGEQMSIVNIRSGDRFIFWHFAKGAQLPWTENTLVKQAGSIVEKKNPRSKEEIEPKDQFFALYDLETKIFYLSDLNSRGFCLEVFNRASEDYKIKWSFKTIFESPEKFAATIEDIKSIQLVASPTLFNQDLFEIEDVTGMADIDVFKLEVKFVKGKNKKEGFIKGLKSLVEKVRTNEIKSLVCRGESQDGFERIFNVDTVTEKIFINVDKREDTGLYRPDDVYWAITNRLLMDK